MPKRVPNDRQQRRQLQMDILQQLSLAALKTMEAPTALRLNRRVDRVTRLIYTAMTSDPC